MSRKLYGDRHPAVANDTTQERVYGKVHPCVASALNQVGAVALRRKHYAEAASAFSRMLSIYRSVYGDKHYLIGTAMGNLGRAYMAEKDYGRAEPLFREAAPRYAATQGPDHVNTGIALAKLGRCLLRQHRNADAEPQSCAAYQVLRRQTVPAGAFLTGAHSDLIAVYDSLNEPQLANRIRAEATDTSTTAAN